MEDSSNETKQVHEPEKLEIKDYDVSSGSLKNQLEGRSGDGPSQAGDPSMSVQSQSMYPTKDLEDAPESVQSHEGGNNTTASEKDIPRNTPPPDYIPTNNNTPGSTTTAAAATQMDTGSFWLEGNYKKIVKKIDDGAKLCDELSAMMAERAEIESLYAKKLKAWNKKWMQSFSKGLEYGSLLQSLFQGLEESNEIADMHLCVQGKISEVSHQIQNWKSESYHKGIMGLKEAKKAEEGFSKGQKPWAKKHDDTIKGRQGYHSASQMLDTHKANEAELKANVTTTTQEQLTKIENKVKKATQDRENALEFYKEAIRDISNYNHKYKDDMKYEFDKWQTSELRRKEFVVEKLKEFKDCVDISRFQDRIEKIYMKMSEVYDAADTTSDVEWFRKCNGPDVPFLEITFIEYDPELHNTAKLKVTRRSGEQNQNNEAKSSPRPDKSSKVCVTL